MLTLTKRQIRPDLNTPFFFETNLLKKEYIEYLNKNYKQTGKLISSSREMSDDKLTVISTVTWDSEESFSEFMRDSFCNENYLNISSEYDQVNRIITDSSGDNGFIRHTYKQVNPDDYFKNITIPEDWNTLEEFVDWYVDQRMPLMIPWNANTIRSDDAVAVCLFKKGRYQVELYLIYPQMYIFKHSHPRMEVITMHLGGGGLEKKATVSNTSYSWGSLVNKLSDGSYHGGDSGPGTGNGFVILAFEKWDNPEEMTSAAVQWKGEIQGPIQAELIKTHYPNALILKDYADITIDTTKLP